MTIHLFSAKKVICYFDEDLVDHPEFCQLGIACGAIAIGIGLISIALDLFIRNMDTKPETKLMLYASSLILSVCLAYLWMGCFGYLYVSFLSFSQPTVHCRLAKQHDCFYL